MMALPVEIQKNLIEKCPQLNLVCKTFRLQNFTKPENLCYPTKENDKDNIIIVEHVLTLKEHKEVLKLEFREGIKGNLRRIEEYIERDNVRSLNTNSIELYNAIWIDIEKLHNHPNKNNIIKNWKYGGAYDYAFSQSSFETYETILRFFFNFVMYIHH
jgi:type IV secretory pathway component VirB8